ncbi:sugar phosphate nucleotidyltransferase [Chitinophagaceae bacterium LB-8]|uniref:Sugar phosphate nucleotidyltransferase n=1 Tax=Paraflavisolibacter caeni TaxID=2982496 RepID=A0A9X2XUR1_9BACT|nr:sugar phosphate nucleotidyltransferase [Paraflavisolibacter caeni]MCU7549255.1 sugar phosphate nucleotidyltransferase [Paraflavisolibacter caeni]
MNLLVLAAGMASRYGSLKQIDKFGPSGESIIDFSIYDAIQAGFTKVVFVIRKEFAQEFKDIFEPRLNEKIETDYVYQEIDSYTEGFPIPEDRIKPWGTAHAVLCAKNIIQEPFAVINADDFYGRDAFEKACQFLTREAGSKLWANICYQLPNTLSEYGSVSRGICQTDENNYISSIVERTKVFKKDQNIFFEENGALHELAATSKASMNFWCFTPDIFNFSQELFQQYLQENGHLPKSEFFIPLVGDEFIQQGKGNIKAITTSEQWFGVTYKEDKPIVQACINRLIADKIYPINLWNRQLQTQY